MKGSDLVRGGVAGFLATLPMTLAMEAMHAMLPWWERYPLPPREITEEVERVADLRGSLDETQHLALTLVNHFAYGTGAGAVYGSFSRAVPAAPALKGAAFGLGVWSVSYLGLMPALGVLRPVTEHPARRNALMIAAHLVWGSATGILLDRIQRHDRPALEGPDADENWPTTMTHHETGEAPPHAIHAF